MKFPDLVHAIKPEPHHEMPQASAAHDTLWDFISLMPESIHMVMWVLSDRGIPLTEVKTALQDAGAHPQVVSKYHGIITSTDGQEVEVDKTFATTGSIIFDAAFIPGGAQSAETLKMQGEAMHFVNEAYKQCKAIAATGEGVELLLETDIQDIVAELQSKGKVLSEHGVVTVQNTADIRSLTQKFIEAIGQHRHWECRRSRCRPSRRRSNGLLRGWNLGSPLPPQRPFEPPTWGCLSK